MKISLNWLKKYVDIPIAANELVQKLADNGLDIESIENQNDKFKNFFVGKVLEVKKHPNADRLRVCKTSLGKEILSIVCGASNVASGQFVCVAKEGAIIPSTGTELKRTKLRGEISEGMICSAKELLLGGEHEGIMVLDDFYPHLKERLTEGKLFSDFVGADVILEIGVTPNRGDLLSHIGVGREVGFLFNLRVKIPQTGEPNSKDKVEQYINVQIENPAGCRRYCGTFLKNVKIKESPDWLRDCLTSAGLRPVNNIVDITNFVMLESGQPLHAFDYAHISGKKIIVKDTGKVRQFRTLEGKDRKLRDGILMICDAEKPLGIAGIMGGENSQITAQTSDVFIESAFFDPVNIRKSAKFLGLQTDSSYRFERGVDIEMVPYACKRAASLMSEYAEGEWLNGVIDVYPDKFQTRSVELSLPYLNKILGIDIAPKKIRELLKGIEIECKEQKSESLVFEIPSFRQFDLESEIDLIEEAARLHGYNTIPDADFDYIFFDSREYSDNTIDFLNEIKGFLTGRGFKEIITNTLVDEERAVVLEENYLKLLNPSSKEMSVVRSTLLTGALETVRNNINFNVKSLKLFETGIVAKSSSTSNAVKGIEEDKQLLMLVCGEHDYETLNAKGRSFDILDLKGEVQVLLEKFNIDNYKLNDYNYNENFELFLVFEVQNAVLARIYEVGNRFLRLFDIEQPVLACEIDLLQLHKLSRREKIYKELSKYPPVLRDLSIIVDSEVKASEIEDVIRASSDSLLKSLKLFDVYNFQGKDLKKKSYTFSLEFSSIEGTLTDEEVNKVQEKVINSLNKKLKAELRK